MFSPYDQFNAMDAFSQYQNRQSTPNVFQGQDPARLAEILRSGSMPQSNSPLSGVDASSLQKLGKAGRSWLDAQGNQGTGFSANDTANMSNSITPSFQSGTAGQYNSQVSDPYSNYFNGVDTSAMPLGSAGANQISPSFQSTGQAPNGGMFGAFGNWFSGLFE